MEWFTATNLAEAEEQLTHAVIPFHLLLLDYELLKSEVSIAPYLAYLRTLPGARATQIILLSQTRFRAEEISVLGVAELVAKPVRPTALLNAVASSIDGKTAKGPVRASFSFDPTLADRLPHRILIADDNDVNIMVASMMLKRFGYKADAVTNGLEVLHALKTKAYDLIFLDVHMPEMDGYDTARHIREAWVGNESKRPRLIALTGAAMTGDRERCLDAGMDGYMTKPLRIEELLPLLESAVPVNT
jgi:CheY-like chemotaxis protein